MTGNANQWHEKIEEHKKLRTEMIEAEMNIQEAMVSYLKTVGETEDFSLRYESFGEVRLHCNGDLFDLHQIGDFCDVFGLELLINNRTIAEDHMTDSTIIKTGYLFTTTDNREKGGINNGL